MALAAEDAAQGELVLAAPEAMAERVIAESGELPMPVPEELAADADRRRPRARRTVRGRPASWRPEPVGRRTAADEPAGEPRRGAGQAGGAGRRTGGGEGRLDAGPGARRRRGQEASGLQKGTRLVQLGAFDSEAITRKAWNQLVARNPDLLSSKNLYIERTTANARVFYRLRVAGFSNTDQTREMCEALRARGVDCIPVTLQ